MGTGCTKPACCIDSKELDLDLKPTPRKGVGSSNFPATYAVTEEKQSDISQTSWKSWELDIEKPLLASANLALSDAEEGLAALEEDISMRARCVSRLWQVVSVMVSVLGILFCIASPPALALSSDKAIQVMLEKITDGVATNIDYSLRLTGNPSYCIVAAGIVESSPVKLQLCGSTSENQRMFDLLDNGCIQLKSAPSLCLAVDADNALKLLKCSANLQQVWLFHTTGTFELKSQRNKCMNVLNNDLGAGSLGLYPCIGNFGDLFAYGGGHFLAPGLARYLHLASSSLSTVMFRFSCGLATILMFSVSISIHLETIARKSKKGMMRFISACVIVLAATQCSGLICIGVAYCQLVLQCHDDTTATLDYTLRMASHPQYCITCQTMKPLSLSMESCKVDDQSQQFLMEMKNSEITIRLRARSQFCLTFDHQRVVMARCTKAAEQYITAPRRTGGSLPLVNTTTCLNLLQGDIDSGTLGFYECNGDINQVFLYSQGNPTVAKLLQQVRWISKAVDGASRVLPLGAFKAAGQYANLSTRIPAL